MNEHLLVKAELLKSEHFTDSEHSMGCKFLCVGVPSFSTEGILGLEEVEFTTVYTGPKAANYLTHLKVGCSYTFAMEKVIKKDGSVEYVTKNIV